MLAWVDDWDSKEAMDVQKKHVKLVQWIDQVLECNNAFPNSLTCNNRV
jgi:hypothetical protein